MASKGSSGRPAGLLDQDDVLKLHAALVAAGLARSRGALLAGLDPEIVAGLPFAETPSEQLLQDVHALNTAPISSDSSIPLSLWLSNAMVLLAGRDDASVFAKAKDRILQAPRLEEPVHRSSAVIAVAGERSQRTQRATDENEGDPGISCAIYVPFSGIADDAWLASAFFLWDHVYRVIPDGLSPKPGSLEQRLLDAAPGFLRRAEPAAALAPALSAYETLLDEFTESHGESRVRALAAAHVGEATLHEAKVDAALIELWNHHGLLLGSSRRGHRVPRFWADLWLTVLAREIGRRDGIAPITDDPLASELIRLSAGDVRALEPNLVAGFLRLALPAPGVAPDHVRRAKIDEWIAAKRGLRRLRAAYHRRVATWLRRAPIHSHMEAASALDALLAEVRREYQAELAPSWREVLRGAGARLLEWTMLSHVERASLAPPGGAVALFEYRVRRALR